MNYYIEGCAAKAEQINAAFEKLGYNTGNLEFTSSQLYYTIEGRVELVCTKSLQDLIKTHPDYQELSLPKPHYDIANFKPYDKVLTRDTERGNWNVNLFSYYIDDEDERVIARFRCINSLWKQCIPFNDDTKHLLGTTDMCDEQYINW